MSQIKTGIIRVSNYFHRQQKFKAFTEACGSKLHFKNQGDTNCSVNTLTSTTSKKIKAVLSKVAVVVERKTSQLRRLGGAQK
jgi:hypothetical protein